MGKRRLGTIGGELARARKHLAKTGRAYNRGVRVTISVAPVVAAMLDALTKTGLHGDSRAKVAERLMCKALTPDVVKWAAEAEPPRLKVVRLKRDTPMAPHPVLTRKQ